MNVAAESPWAFMAAFREIVVQEESITASRCLMFLLALAASRAWTQARPRLALALATLAGIAGLGYWLMQIQTPFGLGTDPDLTSQWAQAGVASALGESSSGFVWGTEAEASWLACLGGLGVPVPLTAAAPQIGVILSLVLLALMPRWSISSPTTSALAGCLLLGGGLWPGSAPYDGLIRIPSSFAWVGLSGLLTAVIARRRGLAGAYRRRRIGVVVATIALAAVLQSLEPLGGSRVGASLLLLCASATLTPLLRMAIRRQLGSSIKARRVEALVLLATFVGSGLFWWEPIRTVPGFEQAKDHSTALLRPLNWIRANVATGDVVLASKDYSAPIAALAHRRVLFSFPAKGASLPEPAKRTSLHASTLRGAPIARLAQHFSVTHLLLGPGETDPLSATPPGDDDEPRLRLVLVYQDVKDFRIFELAKK